jgi:hypothetical protein
MRATTLKSVPYERNVCLWDRPLPDDMMVAPPSLLRELDTAGHSTLFICRIGSNPVEHVFAWFKRTSGGDHRWEKWPQHLKKRTLIRWLTLSFPGRRAGHRS